MALQMDNKINPGVRIKGGLRSIPCIDKSSGIQSRLRDEPYSEILRGKMRRGATLNKWHPLA